MIPEDDSKVTINKSCSPIPAYYDETKLLAEAPFPKPPAKYQWTLEIKDMFVLTEDIQSTTIVNDFQEVPRSLFRFA